MSVQSKSRVLFLSLSCVLSVLVVCILIVCLFSADYRWVGDNEIMRGTRSYGLIRYCYSPQEGDSHSDDSNAKVCYLRKKAPKDERPVNFKQHYDSFELTTLVLLSCSVVCCVLGLCFAICSIFTKFGAFAHSVVLLIAAICCVSGFITYTLFNEQMENQVEKISGNLFMYHYGWAYYLTGAASALLVFAFISSLVGSAFFVVRKSKHHKNNIESIAL